MSTDLEATGNFASPASAGPVELRSLRGIYLRAVDSWIPDSTRAAGGEGLRCSRLVVGFTISLLILGLEATWFFHWAVPAPGALAIDAALVLGLSATLLIPGALRRYDSVEPAANLLVGACYVVMLTIFVVLGGIRSPVLHWCALVPMLAILMGAQRSAWVWGSISLATVFTFSAAEVLGWPLPSYLAESGLAGDRLWAQRSIDVGSWIVMLLMIGLIYERHKDQQTAELALANSELTREIANRRRAEQRTHYLAYHDELTALPNREFFKEQLERAIWEAERDDRMVAVMFLDLDGFKEVNDTYGHRLGDELLQQVAERLRTCVRNADAVFRGLGEEEQDDYEREGSMVSRLGGDEFTILLVNLRNEREAAIIARRVLHSFEDAFVLDDHSVYISSSIGIAVHSSDVADTTELLRNADMAMYSAKDRGKNNYQFFAESMNEEIVHRTTIATDLRDALGRNEFVIHYQPILRIGTGEIVGLEALARWNHPTRGMLLPGEFIEIAEETGLIVPISEDILWRACHQNKLWQQQGLRPVRVAVNISSVQLRQQRLRDHVAITLDGTGLDPQYLELEITESAMMEDEEEAAVSLDELKRLGLGIALDDFGTGYSSLSYAKRYPVDALKIDRSFVHDVDSNPEAQAITTAIIAMAHGLNLKVVAEGVETEAEETFLRNLGCDELQGYRFSVPLPAEEMTRLLRDGVDLTEKDSAA